MLHLFYEADKHDDDNRNKNVRHEEHNPTGIVGRNILNFKQNPTSNEISIEEEKLHQQNQKYEL